MSAPAATPVPVEEWLDAIQPHYWDIGREARMGIALISTPMDDATGTGTADLEALADHCGITLEEATTYRDAALASGWLVMTVGERSDGRYVYPAEYAAVVPDYARAEQ